MWCCISDSRLLASEYEVVPACPALADYPDDLLPNRPFQEADLDQALVSLPERKTLTTSVNLETVTVNAFIVCCS